MNFWLSIYSHCLWRGIVNHAETQRIFSYHLSDYSSRSGRRSWWGGRGRGIPVEGEDVAGDFWKAKRLTFHRSQSQEHNRFHRRWKRPIPCFTTQHTINKITSEYITESTNQFQQLWPQDFYGVWARGHEASRNQKFVLVPPAHV